MKKRLLRSALLVFMAITMQVSLFSGCAFFEKGTDTRISTKDLSYFESGLLPVQEANGLGKWGYINKSGVLKIEAQFDEANDFVGGVALVRQFNADKLITPAGKTVAEYDTIEAHVISDSPYKQIYMGNTKDSKGKDGDVWAVLNQKGKFLFEIESKLNPQFMDGGAFIKVSNGSSGDAERFGVLDAAKKDTVILPTEYRQIEIIKNYIGSYREELFFGIAKKDGGKDIYGFADLKGKVIADPIYENSNNFPITPNPIYENPIRFSNGLAAVKKGDKAWAYIDTKGIEKISYDEDIKLGSFGENGLAVIEKTADNFVTRTVIDQNGAAVVSVTDSATVTHTVELGSNAHFIRVNAKESADVNVTTIYDLKGNPLQAFSPPPDAAKQMQISLSGKNFFKAEWTVKSGMIPNDAVYETEITVYNQNGKETATVTSATQDIDTSFAKYGYLEISEVVGRKFVPNSEKQGELKEEPIYRHIITDLKGKKIVDGTLISTTVNTVRDLKLIMFGHEGKSGYLNHSGKVVMAANYEATVPFGKLHVVYCGNGFGYADKNGKMVIEPKYLSALPFIGGVAAVRSPDNDKWGFINTKGEQVIPCQYERIGGTAVLSPVK